MSTSRFSTEEKVAIVLSGLSGKKDVAQLCLEHGISQALYYRWRDQFLEGGRRGLEGRSEKGKIRVLRSRISELERALGKKAYELEILGKALGR